MKELGIKSLNISNSDAELENDDVGKLRIYFGKDNINEIDNVKSEHSKRPITIKNKQVSKFSYTLALNDINSLRYSF
jgi:hypothetical protein